MKTKKDKIVKVKKSDKESQKYTYKLEIPSIKKEVKNKKVKK